MPKVAAAVCRTALKKTKCQFFDEMVVVGLEGD